MTLFVNKETDNMYIFLIMLSSQKHQVTLITYKLAYDDSVQGNKHIQDSIHGLFSLIISLYHQFKTFYSNLPCIHNRIRRQPGSCDTSCRQLHHLAQMQAICKSQCLNAQSFNISKARQLERRSTCIVHQCRSVLHCPKLTPRHRLVTDSGNTWENEVRNVKDKPVI